MPATSPKLPRKLKHKIDGKDVYFRELTNDDLDGIDELGDQYDEVSRRITDLQAEIKEIDDADERADKRAAGRELARERRRIDTEMLDHYVESGDGERFGFEVLCAVPVRVQTALMTEAAGKIYGEDPTTGASASA